MKKLLVLFILLFAALAFAGETAISSGEQTADAIIFSGAAEITAIQVITDGSNDGTIVVHDGTDNTGKVVFEATVTGDLHYGGRIFVPPIEVYTGIFADITGTGASYLVEYARN